MDFKSVVKFVCDFISHYATLFVRIGILLAIVAILCKGFGHPVPYFSFNDSVLNIAALAAGFGIFMRGGV